MVQAGFSMPTKEEVIAELDRIEYDIRKLRTTKANLTKKLHEMRLEHSKLLYGVEPGDVVLSGSRAYRVTRVLPMARSTNIRPTLMGNASSRGGWEDVEVAVPSNWKTPDYADYKSPANPVSAPQPVRTDDHDCQAEEGHGQEVEQI